MIKVCYESEIDECYGIYSDQNKKIKEKQNEILWNNSEEKPLYVNIDRYNGGDYTETDEDCEEENIEESEE